VLKVNPGFSFFPVAAMVMSLLFLLERSGSDIRFAVRPLSGKAHYLEDQNLLKRTVPAFEWLLGYRRDDLKGTFPQD